MKLGRVGVVVGCSCLVAACGEPPKPLRTAEPPPISDEALVHEEKPAAATVPPHPEIDEARSWAFEPPADEFKPSASFDLRSLNEDETGKSGFVGLSRDRMSFVDGRGKPIRFWAVVDGGYELEPAKMARHVRFLAKYGVNMVRLHVELPNATEGAALGDVDEKVIDGVFRYVAEAKKQGIYLTISPYWAHFEKVPKSWGIEGYDGQSGLWGLLFFDPKLQDAYKRWVKELWTRKNPYTGKPLRDDAAVAIAQIQNEDSLLFWTTQDLREPYAGRLRELFGAMLKKKYGSLEKAQQAWGGVGMPDDDFAHGRAGLFKLWELTVDAPAPTPAKAKRLDDQLRFLVELQRGFYADMVRYLKQTLGLHQLVNDSNWRTADPVLLEDLERWTYTTGDVAALNRYAGGPHLGDKVGWRVDPGQFFANRSTLRAPETFPGAIKQTVGQPFIITESSWTFPELYQTEGPFLFAAYGSLTGVDALYWFAHGDETWSEIVWPFWKAGDGKNSLKKWDSSLPQQLGMFPAAAFAFRTGLIKSAAEPAVHEERSVDALLARRMPIVSEAGKFDPNRDPGAFAPASSVKQEVDRLAFFVGPVEVKLGGDEKKNHVIDLSKYIDEAGGKVRSMTGEIELDFHHGVCSVNAPGFQGVTGFLKDAGGVFKLGSLTLTSDDEYASVAAVALDGRPLAQSAKILVQVGTLVRPTGWMVEDDTEESDGRVIAGLRIADTGKPPLRIAKAKLKVSIATALTKVTRLDPAGYPAGTLESSSSGGVLSFDFPGDALYVVVQ